MYMPDTAEIKVNLNINIRPVSFWSHLNTLTLILLI